MSTRQATPWRAIDDARLHIEARVPFCIDGRAIGSVAVAHLGALRRWASRLTQDDTGVHLVAPGARRDAALAAINEELRDLGLIRAWRDEAFALFGADGEVLGRIERASARFWGTLTEGAHANGWVRGADGRPAALWVARRALTKATDPGKLDNLVGGGVPWGQSPHQALRREAWEEAGLDEATAARATPGNVLRIDADVPEGRMVEHLHVYDLELPAGLEPRNQDGEVGEIRLMPLAEAAACAAAGEMTTDAALVTLDFLLRHQLLPPALQQTLTPRMAGVRLAGRSAQMDSAQTD